jgi:hypothetical protein
MFFQIMAKLFPEYLKNFQPLICCFMAWSHVSLHKPFLSILCILWSSQVTRFSLILPSALTTSSSSNASIRAWQQISISWKPAPNGPLIHTMCPVWMQTPSLYFRPLLLNLWDRYFGSNLNVCADVSEIKD